MLCEPFAFCALCKLRWDRIWIGQDILCEPFALCRFHVEMRWDQYKGTLQFLTHSIVVRPISMQSDVIQRQITSDYCQTASDSNRACQPVKVPCPPYLHTWLTMLLYSLFSCQICVRVFPHLARVPQSIFFGSSLARSVVCHSHVLYTPLYILFGSSLARPE